MKKTELRPLDRRHDILLPSALSSHNILVRRVQQWVKGKKVILFKIDRLPPHVPITSPLLELIFGDPTQYTGPSFILEERTEWVEVGKQPAARFNCHAYSLGERVGLTPEDWVEGEPTDLSMDTNPMQILLSAYFTPFRTLDVAHAHSLVHDQGLREGDVISFTYERPYWGIVHQHSGRVMHVNSENWLTSKFQVGRLIVTSIKDALEFYPDTRKVRVYRFRGD
ncbi:MAG: hypothetical protein AAB490_00465 [Patescibacteria group bacterium]